MSYEGMQEPKREPTPIHLDRASVRRAEERDFASSEYVNSLGEELRDLQTRIENASHDILLYQTQLNEGGKHIFQQDGKLKELALKLGRDTRERLASREKEKEGLEKTLEEVKQQIIDAGGNPGDYMRQ